MGKGIVDKEQKQKKAQKDLHNAISCGSVRNLQKAHKNGADINHITPGTLVTPMYVAMIKHHTDIIACLFDLGVINVDTRTHHDYTALGIAVMHGDTVIVEELLKRGADANAVQTDKKIPLLILAIRHLSILVLLVTHGADVNLTDSSGATPLYRASQENRTEAVQFLLSKGADVDTYQDAAINPIGVAVLHNFFEVVRILLRHGANVNSVQYPGYSLVCVAVQEDNAAMIDLLASHGADVNMVDYSGATAAFTASSKNYIASLKVLVKHGAGLNIFFEDPKQAGMTKSCTYIAAGCGHLAVLNYLCENGADFTTKCTDKLADPLFIAAQEGRIHIVKALVGFGAFVDPSDQTDDCSPLFIAAKNGHLDVVQYLADQGASVHVRATKCEVTPMIAASFHGHMRMMKLLQSLGADIEHATKDYVSPLSLSNLTHNTKVIKYTQKLISKKTAVCQSCQTVASPQGPRLKLCSGCESVRYCSRQCQLDHYKEHKSECKKVRAAKKKKKKKEEEEEEEELGGGEERGEQQGGEEEVGCV
jgi:ankyrin repeat protein